MSLVYCLQLGFKLPKRNIAKMNWMRNYLKMHVQLSSERYQRELRKFHLSLYGLMPTPFTLAYSISFPGSLSFTGLGMLVSVIRPNCGFRIPRGCCCNALCFFRKEWKYGSFRQMIGMIFYIAHVAP